MFDTFAGSILQSGLTPVLFLICTAVSLLLGLGTALIYMHRSHYSKSFVITLALLAAVLAGSLWLSQRAEDVSQRFAGAAAEIRQLTEAQDWKAAAHRLTALQQEWEDTLPGLQMQLNHEDTDELTLAMRTLEAGIRTQSALLCALGCTQMEESAQHLSHRDAFNWANIL